MKKQIKKAIEKYQCPGCVSGSNIECFESANMGEGCGKHQSGTITFRGGKFFLGLPIGFCRTGEFTSMKPSIFNKMSDYGAYNMFNVPVWKYKNKAGHVIVRGISPRINAPFIHIFLEDCLDKIDCIEITESLMEEMD